MVMALAFDDAKAHQVRIEGRDGKKTGGGATTHTPFFGWSDKPELPHANLAQREPNRVSPPHFHQNDQFQVVVDGKGTLGKHALAPYCVHFSRAYTPYGPLASAPDSGLAFFVMRAHHDPGSQDLPQEQQQLKSVKNRQPWQITRRAIFPERPLGTADGEVALRAIPDIADDRGLAAYTLRMKAHTQTDTPDPSRGDGQYLIVTKGSMLYEGKEYGTWSLIFVTPRDAPLRIIAGSTGAEALVLNFPVPRQRGGQ